LQPAAAGGGAPSAVASGPRLEGLPAAAREARGRQAGTEAQGLHAAGRVREAPRRRDHRNRQSVAQDSHRAGGQELRGAEMTIDKSLIHKVELTLVVVAVVVLAIGYVVSRL